MIETHSAMVIFGFGIGMQEMIVIGIIGVLLFGKRLPEVGRSIGKSLGEFKRGMQGLESELNSAMHSQTYSASSYSPVDDEAVDDYEEVSAPKFEPPTGEPTES